MHDFPFKYGYSLLVKTPNTVYPQNDLVCESIHKGATVMQVENGLVETIAVLISKMPRLRPGLPPGSPGQAFNFKPEFTKASARWLWAEDHGT